jgi:uncharacterized protein YkwD
MEKTMFTFKNRSLLALTILITTASYTIAKPPVKRIRIVRKKKIVARHIQHIRRKPAYLAYVRHVRRPNIIIAARRPVYKKRVIRTPHKQAPKRKPSTPLPSATNTFTQTMGKEALQLTNEYRKKKGLPPLQWHNELAQLAQEHSVEMGNHAVPFGHDGFNARVNRLSRRPRGAAENVFMYNHRTGVTRLCVDSLIKSPGHHKNIVGNYTHCGIGVHKNAQGYWYFTQFFANY